MAMSKDLSQLTPTVVADKNGKITTVHKKNASTVPASASKVPAPSLAPARSGKAVKPTTASRVSGIENVLSDIPRKLNKVRTRTILQFATNDQLQTLDDVLAGFEESTPHEQMIVRSILLPLTTRNRNVNCVHELLAMRSAFNSEKVQTDGTDLKEYVLEEYIRGIRKTRIGFDSSYLDLPDPHRREQDTALLRFAYEMKERAPWNGRYNPTYSAQIGSDTDECAQEWEREDLVKLISDFPERVEEMIEVALDQKTSDPQRIWSSMQHEGHTALTAGAL